MSELLFSTFTLGRLTLKNRVVMAPMTRCRSEGNLPGTMTVTYYQQRGEAGLIVTEGTSPSPNGLGYARIPGLFSRAQADAWKKVTAAVHGEGAAIFVQLMHTGRVSHPLNMPPGTKILAPSAIAAPGTMFTDAQGPQPFPVPAAMSEAEIEQAIEEYAAAAELAISAGFDGVELHGANGYLIDQFLNTAANQRTDSWGGTIENRIRFATAVAARVVTRIGGERVGMRLSPYGAFNGMTPDDVHDELYQHLVRELNTLGLVYLHLVDHSSLGAPPVKGEIKQLVRQSFAGALILSGGYDGPRAEHDLVEEYGDLVAFGRPFIANPRLVSRLRSGAALASPDPDTFYSPGAQGYTDYPR